MLVVMNKDCSASQIDKVCEAIRDLGFEPRPMPGAERTVVCITGNKGAVPIERFAGLEGILEIIRVSKPYKLVSRETRSCDTVVTFGDRRIGGGETCLIAGPCSVETEEATMRIAEQLRDLGVGFFRAGAFKPRTSPYDFQGLGHAGLEILAKVKRELGLRIVTEVLDTTELAAVAEVADILQVGARNMHNTPLLKQLGGVDKPVLLKRGMAATLDEFFMAAEYIMLHGNYNVIFCERGIRTVSTHSRFTLDVAAVAAIKQLSHLPVLVDPSHAAGVSDMVEPLGYAGMAAGADGLIVEVHDNPCAAWCDGLQALHPSRLQEFIRNMNALRELLAPTRCSS